MSKKKLIISISICRTLERRIYCKIQDGRGTKKSVISCKREEVESSKITSKIIVIIIIK